MPSPTSSFETRELRDRCTVFSVSSDEGEEQLQVAFGDGEMLPYRSFILKSVFDLASPYLLSPHSTVTALDPKRLAGLVGAMLARQSRIPGTVVDVLVKEFLVSTPEESEELDIPVGDIKVKKLEGIIERILIQYGDDSVQELECATVLFNSVSNLASKVIEDRRLGGFIEQSSRYVLYSERDPVTGRWMYLREPTIMASPEVDAYVHIMDRCFELYVRLSEKLTEHYASLKPVAEAAYAIRPGDAKTYRLDELTDPKEIKEFNRVYKFDLKTRACDTARIVLPAATITNLAMVANGRTFEHLLKRLYSSGYPEFNDLAVRLHETLNKVIPKYVKRASPNGEVYVMAMDARIKEQIRTRFPEFLSFKKSAEEVAWLNVPNLVRAEAASAAHLLAVVYFPFVCVPYGSMVTRLERESLETLTVLLKEVLGTRQSRRDRCGRGFEHGYPCTFETVGNFGIYRDLQRHRMLTQQRQLLNPHLGFTVPQDVEDIGLGDEVRAVETEVRGLYDRLHLTVGPDVAQYCVLFGHHIRFMMGFNLREAQHMLELRTIPQGHPDYRRVCQKMEIHIRERAPWIAEAGLLQFVDHAQYPWARAAAEARQSSKRLAMGMTDE
ncbi:FAD-dependent thymidylate synthase [Candidatus Uhrbacteria bacterium]|nr:FAD-dependent thymidylate synthase [Candidatus Uhrbacteria bacterium]